VHTKTEPKKLTPDVDVPVRLPRTGVNIASGARELGVEEVAVLEDRTRVAIRTRGAGGRRLQANELAAPDQDEVASGEKECIIPHTTGP